MPRLLVLAVVIALPLVGCGDDASGPDGNASADEEWGPLAVIDGPPNLEDAGADGVLKISDLCVTLNQPETGGTTTLAWPSEATTWNPDKGTISYGDNEATELSDGDHVTFSGGFKDASSNVEWVVDPDPSCPGEGAFFVGDVSEGFETGR